MLAVQLTPKITPSSEKEGYRRIHQFTSFQEINATELEIPRRVTDYKPAIALTKAAPRIFFTVRSVEYLLK